MHSGCTRLPARVGLFVVSLAILVALVTLCAAPWPAMAATPEKPATPITVWLEADLETPVWFDDTLRITLRPDEKACSKLYGDEWEERCTVRSGETDALVRGLVVTPEIEGRWRWIDGMTLGITPEKGWPSDALFTVNLQNVPLPAGVAISNPKLSVSTPPQAALVEDGKLWIDPAPGGRHAVSFGMRFTTPPDKAMVEKALRLAPVGGGDSSGFKLGPLVVTWFGEGTRCVVRADIVALPREATRLQLKLPGFRSLERVQGKRRFDWRAGREDAQRNLVVTGTSTLFKPEKLDFQAYQNAALQTEYHLVTQFSLRISPEEVMRYLTVHELPLVRDAENIGTFDWLSVRVAPEDLAKARLLKVEPVTVPGESGDVLRFRVPVTPGHHVAVSLRKGLGPSKGLTLDRDYVVTKAAQVPKASADFLQPGNVLPLGGAKKLDIVSTNLTHVEWTLQRVMPDRLGLEQLAEMFNSNALWSGAQLNEVSQSASGRFTVPAPSVKENAFAPVFHSLNLEPLLLQDAGGPVTGLMLVELKGYQDDRVVSRTKRLVMVTDLGLVLKKDANNGQRVFVCSLSRGEPVAGVTVSIVGANGLPVAEATTGADGSARLPSVQGLQREKEPRAVVARLKTGKQTDLAWMALSDTERQLDYSRFAVAGQRSAAEGINAFVFGQRGVFRPGETLYFGYILNRNDWKPLPPGMPLHAVLRDPSGNVVLRTAITAAEGLGECSWASPDNALTGVYRLSVTTPATGRSVPYDEDGQTNVDSDSGLSLGFGSVLVEEFQPDTLSVKAELMAAGAPMTARGWIRPLADASALVTLRNLYGLPATDRRVRAFLSLTPASLRFAGFESFTFSDMLPWKGDGLHSELPEGRTGADGQTTFALGLEGYQNGTLQAQLMVEGFEPDGGRSVSTEQGFLVSPLPYMLGYRPAGTAGNLNFLPKDSASGLEFVAVNDQLTSVDPGPLHVEVAERRYVTSLVRDGRGQFRYDETPVDTPVATTTVRLKSGEPVYWALPTARPGEFLLTVRGNDQVLARVPFTVAGNDDLRPALSDINALPSTQLRVRLDKEDYAPDDTVNVFIAAPFDGVGLLSLERDSVVAHTWFTAKAGHSVQKLTIPRDFEGRGYINVSLARSMTSPDIFLQPHTYAVAPLSVNLQARDMGLAVKAPAFAKPGEALPVRLTAAKKGKALVFAVDEGVLQLTRFITPDPLRYLLLDRALEVNTFQFFDRLMPDHARLAGRVAAFGGGMGAMGGRFNNPFKRRAEPPMAWWSGVVEVGPDGLDMAVPVPDYINSRIRIMAVGLSSESAGNAKAETTVRSALVLTPQLPVLASPGDTFVAALAVANTQDAPTRVTLRVESDPALTLGEVPTEPFELGPGEERLLPFTMSVTDIPGHAEARFFATDSTTKGTVRRVASLSVRPATLPMHTARNGRAIGSQELVETRKLYPFYASSSATVSASPLPALRGILRYLNAYPYGCVEQRLSKAFPLIFLYRQPELDAALRQEDPAKAATMRREALDNALAALRGSSYHSGGVHTWAYGGGRPDRLLTAYAADWLLAMREAGLGLPGDLTLLFDILDKLTSQDPTTIEEVRAQAYALWVLTRAGYITTQKLEQLTDTLNRSNIQRDMTFSLMAGAWAGLRMHDEAAKALTRYEPLRAGEACGLLDVVAAEALHVAVLAQHFPDRLTHEADKLAESLLTGLNANGGYATFAAAQSARALLALTTIQNATGDALSGVELVCVATQEGFKPEAKSRKSQGLLSLDAPGCARYELRVAASNQGNTPALYWEMESAGYDRVPPTQATASGLEVTRVFHGANGAVIDPTSPTATVAQGDILRVQISVQLTEGPDAPVVLANLLPGGFEQVWAHPDNSTTSGENRIERREDRLEMHTEATKRPQTFVAHIRAVNKGRVAVPAVRAEGLYNRALQANTAAGTLTVK